MAAEFDLPNVPQGGGIPPRSRSVAETVDLAPGCWPTQLATDPDLHLSEAVTRFELLEEVARGGMGVILRVRDPKLDREVALKVLLDTHAGRPEMRSRFLEEAQVGAKLQHPGIIPVYEIGECADGRPYFAMKLLRGRTLANLLDERKDPLEDRSRLLQIFEKVCQTMAYAHRSGVIHRDLKPANIIVGEFGEVNVIDWGLAKRLHEHAPSTAAANFDPPAASSESSSRKKSDTQSGAVLGTPAYMPPEQATGNVDTLDTRCDVFGLGAILCEILTGYPPYQGEDANQLLQRALNAELADAYSRLGRSCADPELINLAEACLQADVERRPPHAATMAGEMNRYLESLDARLRILQLQNFEARTRAIEEGKRRRLFFGFTILLLAVILMMIAIGVFGKERKKEASAVPRGISKLQVKIAKESESRPFC